jgi:hypothetical protein
MPKPAKRARTGAEEGASGQKLASAVLSSVTCPISQALVVDPVMAEDGAIYERDQITKWLSSNNRSPVTNAAMGARLVAAQNSRSLVESLLESDGVDDDAAAAWHAASARKKISGALPGGIDAAKVHLDRAAALVESSTECDVLREALALRDQHKGVLTKAAAAGVTHEVESILSGRTRSPMTAWRGDLGFRAVIRLIDDRDELKRLFGRPAPGSQKAIGWRDHLRLEGREGRVESVAKKYRAYRVSVAGIGKCIVPFDACIPIDVRSNSGNPPDSSDDSDDSSSDDSDIIGGQRSFFDLSGTADSDDSDDSSSDSDDSSG